MHILVTGGCGYIGRNMVDSLLLNGHNVIVVDSLINGSLEAINERTIFYKEDIRDINGIRKIFRENKIDLVMDFAALIDVEESFKIPEEYLDVNVNGLGVILRVMDEFDVKKIIFSSTAAVYDTNSNLVTEESITKPINPYGTSKLMGEKLLDYYAKYKGFKYVVFRYFNVIGSAKLGYSWDEFSSIVPKILTSIKSGNKFIINGNKYDTKDGTCIRDYIHMIDLISAHQGVIDNFDNIELGCYNLSIGNGTSILELLDAIKNNFELIVDYEVGPNRSGDIIISIASNEKIKKAINWNIKYDSINKMVKKIKEENN